MDQTENLNTENLKPGVDGFNQPGSLTQPKKEKGGTNAARQTLYRVTIRNQLRSVSIADGKANILIGINTILISLIVAFLGAESSFAGISFLSEPDLNIPLTLFLLACLVSAYFAILAVRPMVRPWKSDAPRKLFFKDVKDTELEEYQEFLKEVLKSGDSVYETLNSDMWLLSKGLISKYNLLRAGYTVFLIGRTLLVGSFLILTFTL
jgi:hypothetical protein